MELEIRDSRGKEWFWLDNEYLNGYARLLGASCTVVYLSLCRHADNNTQQCFPSMKLIATENGISTKTVERATKKLEEWGIICVQRGKKEDGTQANNIYILTAKKTWKSKPTDNKSHGSPTDKMNESRQTPRPHNKTHINNTHIPVEEKTDSVAIAPEEFSLSKVLDGIRSGEDRDMKVIGLYIIQKKIEIDNRAQFSKLVARCRGQINAYKKKYKLHPFEGVSGKDIKLAMQVAEKKYEGKWTFETVMNRVVELAKGI